MHACRLSFVAGLALLGAATAGAWQVDIDGRRPGALDAATAVAVAPGGDAVVAGSIESPGRRSGDFAVVRHDGASGVERWRTLIDGPASSVDYANAVAVDAAGDVVVVGVLRETIVVVYPREGPREIAVPRAVALKLDGATGAERWRTIFRGTDPNGYGDAASALAIDAAGDVLVAGQVWDASPDMLVAKLAGATGAVVWRADVDGGADLDDAANAVALAPDGTVVVAGMLTGATSNDLAAVALDPTDGTERWRTSIDGAGHSVDVAQTVAVGPGGEVAVGGFTSADGTSFEFTVARLAATTGSVVWRATIPATTQNFGEARAVAFDAAGAVLAAGSASGALGQDLAVVKLDGATGAERWRVVRDGGAGASDGAAALVIDPGGDAIVAGGMSSGPTPDLVVLRLAGETGDERWRLQVDGPAHEYDGARAVALGADGRVFAAGVLSRTPIATTISYIDGDFATLALDAASGAEQWRAEIDGEANGDDAARVAATLADGDVLAAGDIVGKAAVVRLAGADGSERWRAAPTYGTTNAVAVDPAGDVIAAGLFRFFFGVVKLGGADGRVLWQQELSGLGNYPGQFVNEARAVAVGSGSAVAAAGYLIGLWSGRDFAVCTFDGASGNVRWLWTETAFRDSTGSAVGFLADGAVVAAGAGARTGFVGWSIVALDGARGAVRWRHEVAGDTVGGEPRAIALDTAGDVLVAGFVVDTGGGYSDMAVVKLDAASGGERWRRVVDGGGADAANAVALDSRGDAYVAGVSGPENALTVVAVDGVTGAERWRTVPADVADGSSVVVDPNGDVLAGGRARRRDDAGDVVGDAFVLVALDAATGVERWRRTAEGSGGAALAVAVDGAGNAVVAGVTRRPGRFDDFTVMKVGEAAGQDAFCGDGRLDAGEECDDGNAVDADCCSSACVAAADPDGDGVCGVADGCPAVPDPGQEDADGDGIGDACDPCTNGSELAGVVTVGGLGLPAGDERLWLDADLPLPARDRQFAPAEHGLRILIADAAGAPVVEATVPPGRSPSGGLGGWSRAAGGWRYRAAKDATGIRRVAGRIVGGRLRVHVRAGHGTYAVDPARTPLRVTLVLDPPSARTGACAEAIVAACVAHRDVVRCATSAPALRSARARRL